MTNQEFAFKLAWEGLDYALLHYWSLDDLQTIEDHELREKAINAAKALRELGDRLNTLAALGDIEIEDEF